MGQVRVRSQGWVRARTKANADPGPRPNSGDRDDVKSVKVVTVQVVEASVE